MNANIWNFLVSKKEKGGRKKQLNRAWALKSTEKNICNHKSPAIEVPNTGGERPGLHASLSLVAVGSSLTPKNTTMWWGTKKRIKSDALERSHTSNRLILWRRTNQGARYTKKMTITSTKRNRIQKLYTKLTKAILRLQDLTQATSILKLHQTDRGLSDSQISITQNWLLTIIKL